MQDIAFFAKGMLVVFLLLGGGALYLGHSQAQHATDLQREGVAAAATITEKFEQASTQATSNDQRARGTTHHVVVYTFPLAGGASHAKRENLPESLWSALQVGQDVPVRYWAQDPEVATIQEDGFARSAAFLSTAWKVLFGLAAACGLFAKLFGKRRVPRGD